MGKTRQIQESHRVVSEEGLLKMRRIPAFVAVVALATTIVWGGSGLAAQASPARSTAWCPNAISWKSARQSVGKRVRVKARVAGALYARGSNGRPTFIDLGYDYPDSRRLTLLIWGENRVNFPRAPERMFRAGTMICAQGRVSTYRGLPQIEVARWDARGGFLAS